MDMQHSFAQKSWERAANRHAEINKIIQELRPLAADCDFARTRMVYWGRKLDEIEQKYHQFFARKG